jgi:hypothetical protein
LASAPAASDIDVTIGNFATATFTATPLHLGFEEYDVANQIAVSHHYLWPAELDLMARLAGMTLRERLSTWNGDAFTSESPSHISVLGDGRLAACVSGPEDSSWTCSAARPASGTRPLFWRRPTAEA